MKWFLLLLIAQIAFATPLIPDQSITTAKIKDLNVTTVKLAAASVTQAKRAALGQQVSSSSGGFSTTSVSLVDVTNLSVTITTTGRPVYIGLINDGTNSGPSYIGAQAPSNTINITLALLRAGSEIIRQELDFQASAGTYDSKIPVTSFSHVDVPSAGTYTYKVQALSSFGSTASVIRAKLIAYEL